MTTLIRLVSNSRGFEFAEPTWLKALDVNAHRGQGSVATTTDRREALRFADMGEAFKCWKRQSTVAPLRADGRPNRPLTAFSITFDDEPDEATP